MMKFNKHFPSSLTGRLAIVLCLILFAFLFNPFFTYAQQDSPGYDRYTEKLHSGKYAKEKDNWIETIGNAPVVPIELTKRGVEKALIVIEKTHLNDKVEYVWGKIHEWGFHPTGQTLHDHPQVGYNLLWDRHELVSASPLVEHAGFTLWNGLNQWGYYDAAAKLNADNILKTGFYANQLFKYEHRPREVFYGIGHNTSQGDSFVYMLNAMNYETRFGRDFKLPWGKLNAEGQFNFRGVRILGGHDGAKQNIRDFFQTDARLPGVTGGKYYTLGFNLMHDDRDSIDDPHKGGYRKFTFLFNDGVDGAQYHYAKYRFDVAQFFPVFKNGNVFAIRFAGEMNDKIKNGTLPFFDMARLGGFSNLRGYEYNRFFDNKMLWMSLEYRYNVWTFKKYKVDLVPFLDMGSVFGQGGGFTLGRTRFSYGGAIRYKIRDRVNIDLEGGHSDEGTQFYVKYATSF